MSPQVTVAGCRMVQGTGYPVRTPPPRVGRLSNQVRPLPRSNVPKNNLEPHPPQRREHSRTNEKAVEAPIDLNEPTSLAWGLFRR
jgi:hypothetical protein